jgi:uncharacterized membrane protein YfcA
MDQFDPFYMMIFLLGAGAGGFVTGLAGFGTALIVSAFWLHFMDPIVVAPLAAACSVVGQVSALKGTWRHLQWKAVTPFLIGAFIGLPLGVWSLDYVEPGHVKLAVGVFLVGYSIYSLFFLFRGNIASIKVDNRFADGAVGIVGGVMGGIAGLSGPAPLIWCQLRGLAKTVQRGLYQPYNAIILGTATGVHALYGRIDGEVGGAFLISIPATVIGSWIGTMLYHRLDDRLFNVIVQCLLLLSGAMLLGRSFF